MSEYRFGELLADLGEMHRRKAHDYSDEQNDNLRAARRLGLSPYIGVLLRMQDKMCRLCTLAQKEPLVVEETVTDTLKDLATYALLAIILREEEQVDE